MKIMIIGAGGQLGRELVRLIPDGVRYYHSSNANGKLIDLANSDSILNAIEDERPDIIINVAAVANVDLCERDHMLAYQVNALALDTMVRACRKYGSTLIHISTDYVFDGEDGHYKEDSIPNPINYYGLSKLIGDSYALSYERSIVIRTSGVFGYTKNFPMFVFEKLKKGEHVSAIKGYYSPIHSRMLASAISDLLESDFTGILNVAGERISRFDLALKIAREFGFDSSLIGEADSIQSMGAKRPFDSSLDITVAKEIIHHNFYSTESNIKAMKSALEESEKI